MGTEGVYRVADFLDGIRNYRKTGGASGFDLGIPCLSDYYRPQPGYMSIVTGIPGHGKSEVIDWFMVNLSVLYGWKHLLFSPENYPLEQHFVKLAEKYVGKHFLTMGKTDLATAVQWIGDYFTWLYPPEDKVTLDDILAMAQSVHDSEVNGVKGFVLDPWNEVEHRRPSNLSETEYISQALSKIRRFARKNNIHVWIVAHPTKLQKDRDTGKYNPPTPYEISGCHSADTEVLTEGGWKKHGEVTLADRVACFDLKTGTWAYDNPSKIWEYDYEGPMHHFRGKTFDCKVTPSHRMVVKQTWREKKPMKGTGLGRPMKYEDGWCFVEAQNIASELKVPLASKQDQPQESPTEIHGFNAEDAMRILGWWIAEGHLSMGSLSFCQRVGSLAEEMEATLTRMGAKFHAATVVSKREHEQPMRIFRLYKRAHPEFVNWVLENCNHGCPNVRIPREVFGYGENLRRILLEALVDGDGNRNRSGVHYTTTSRGLNDDVMQLAISLGHPACFSVGKRTQSHWLDKYQTNIGLQRRIDMCLRKERHLTIEQYTGKVYCLTVPTGAYITRRQGKMMISGNSANWRNKADYCLTIHRPDMDCNRVQVIVNKVKFKSFGKLGTGELDYDFASGRFKDPSFSRYELPKVQGGEVPF